MNVQSSTVRFHLDHSTAPATHGKPCAVPCFHFDTFCVCFYTLVDVAIPIPVGFDLVPSDGRWIDFGPGTCTSLGLHHRCPCALLTGFG